ncbi:hypothetical protein [Burkholderia ubonensis]|uniref:Uncharacterized protein n=1 Tax=Burkholderia ubonensis TaxID=101571 RepID=A0ABD4DZQ7_9BURK|nr:hypothetical protein [Burkholderia ubonensis]KVN83481.1 hypothetical protein WJ68_16345 [Burkholderia ubonensis]
MADNLTKQQRQAAARMEAERTRLEAYLNKGNPNAPAPAVAPVAPAAPAQSTSPLSAPEPAQEAPEVVQATPEVAEPAATRPEAAAEPQHAPHASEAALGASREAPTPVSESEAPTEPAKPVSGAKKGHSKAETPWAHAHPRVTVNFSTKFSEELHMQMTWLTENVPKTSIQKIVQEATAQYVAKKIKEHYKP